MPNAVSPSGAPPNTLAMTAPRPFMAAGAPDGIGQDVDQPVRRKIERLADRQRLAQRLPVHQERQIDRKFHGRAGADSARHVRCAGIAARASASPAQHRRSRRRRDRTACLPAPEPCFRRPGIRRRRRPVAPPRSRPISSSPDEPCSCRSRACRRACAFSMPFGRAVHRLGRRIVQQHHDDDLAALRRAPRGREQLCAGIDQRLRLRVIRDSRRRLRVRPTSIAARSMIPFFQFRICRFSFFDLISGWVVESSERETRRDFARSVLRCSGARWPCPANTQRPVLRMTA